MRSAVHSISIDSLYRVSVALEVPLRHLTDVRPGKRAVVPSEEAEKIKEMTDKDPAAKQWFQTTYVPKMMSAYGPLMSIGQKCQSDKDFMAAMDAMPVGKKRKVDEPTTAPSAPAPAPTP